MSTSAPQRQLNYPADLPVSQAREEILRAIAAHQVVILCGATGSGKSTQLPKFCLESGRGQTGLIAHTQPRRIAARALAERVAEEIGEEVGQTIGWQVRFKQVLSANTQVKLMTDGVLLNELRRDPLLRRYDTIIVDEAHERSLNIDFLLGCLRRILPKRPDLKLIITSATLDAEKFSAHFAGAPVIEVPGRSYPIELRYRDPEELDPNEAATRAVKEIWRDSDGDILIFLPGEREIRDLAHYLSEYPGLQKPAVPDILPLYARLGSAKQQKIFAPAGGRRVVLATNVAETSLTVPRIRHVIDFGTARVSRYNPRSKVQNLLVEPVAQANADQRKGRCGRTAAGICIRLFGEDDFNARPRFAEPEIQRTNLAAVLLQMADLKLGDPEEFPFIDAPHQRYLRDAQRLLEQLGALRADGGLSRIGHELARLPVDPRFGRILVAAREAGCLGDMIPIVAVLSMQDPRERDFELRAKIDEAQAPFRDKSSDFITLLNVWRQARVAKTDGSNADFRRWCQSRYLNARRMQEWRDLVRQIRNELHAQHKDGKAAMVIPPESSDEALNPTLLHQCLLPGLLDHIATHDSDGDYRGPRGARWRIHPDSSLRRRTPAWIVGAEIVSTRRTYARTTAQVDPLWIETAAKHLVKRQALEPSWDPRRGEVLAQEQVTLFGLILVHGRAVNYARYDRGHARQIFIEQALVAGRWGPGELPAFLKANQSLLKRLRDEENRQRSRAIVCTDDEIAAWYAERIPPRVCNRQQLLQALKDGLADGLVMQEADLRRGETENLADAYPNSRDIDGIRYRLRYTFDPGHDDDGITLELPIANLNQLSASALNWLVPGALPEKIDTLIRGLPKQLRRRFVPVNETVQACVAAMEFGAGDFYDQLARCLQRRAGEPGPTASELRLIELPDRLRMRLKLLDGHGKVLATGRSLDALRQQHAGGAQKRFQELHDARFERQGLSTWEGDALPLSIRLAGGVSAFPCLQDAGSHVDIVLKDDPVLAAALHRRGVLRLLYLAQLAKLKPRLKSLPERSSVQLRLAALPSADREMAVVLEGLELTPTLGTDLIEAVASRAIADTQYADTIRSDDAFQAALLQASAMTERLQKLWRNCQQLASAFADWQQWRWPANEGASAADIQTQLQWLFAPGWLARTPDPADLARYLQALSHRVQKWQQDPHTEAQRLRQLAPHWERCQQAIRDLVRQRRPIPAELLEYRWMIEEFRVSVFAQTLKTRQKVSDKRLDEAWRKIPR